MRNYFRNGRNVFFFDDADLESIRRAHAAATSCPGGTPALFVPVPYDGPWDAGELVGHRPRKTIAADITESMRELEELVDARDGDTPGWRENIVRGHVEMLTRELEERDRAQFGRRREGITREAA